MNIFAKKKRVWRLGLVIFVFLFLPSLMAPFLDLAPLHEVALSEKLAPPSWAHPFGQDALGADLFAQLLHGGRVSLLVGVVTAFISVFLGTLVGLWSGYHQGWSSTLLMRLVDVFMAFPGILLAIALAGILGPGVLNLVLALSFLGWAGFARLVRAEVLKLRKQDYVMSATALGASTPYIMRVHILPNLMGPLMVQASFSLATIILAESSLSFLGLGVPPGTPSWGGLLAEGRYAMFEAPHLVFFPGAAITLSVILFNQLGDSLQDALDRRFLGKEKN